MSSIQLPLPFPPEIEWHYVPGYKNRYQVSNTGLVRNTETGKLRKAVRDPRGYLHVQLCVDRKGKGFAIHRLVMLAFVGPSTLDVNHKNGVTSDNRLENLEYLTRLEHSRHTTQVLGKVHRPKGEKHPHAKFNDNEVREIRRLASAGSSQFLLAEVYGVHRNTIHYIVRRRTWSHVE